MPKKQNPEVEELLEEATDQVTEVAEVVEASPVKDEAPAEVRSWNVSTPKRQV